MKSIRRFDISCHFNFFPKYKQIRKISKIEQQILLNTHPPVNEILTFSSKRECSNISSDKRDIFSQISQKEKLRNRRKEFTNKRTKSNI